VLPVSPALPSLRRRRSRTRRAALLLLAGVVLVATSPARAGGDFVDITVGGGRVWFAGGPGVRSLDARTGRTLTAPRLLGAAYPLSVTLASDAAWVASVEGGYVWGTLSRIDSGPARFESSGASTAARSSTSPRAPAAFGR
jgi:hypothetical protein